MAARTDSVNGRLPDTSKSASTELSPWWCSAVTWPTGTPAMRTSSLSLRNEESAKTAWYSRTSVPPRDPDSTRPKKTAVIAATTKNAASRIAGPVIFIGRLLPEAADRIGGRQVELAQVLHPLCRWDTPWHPYRS